MSLNKAMLIGHVGQEPEIRYVDNGSCTARLSLATSTPGYTLANGTQVPERTEWHKLLFWGKLAQVVERYVHKGDKLYVEGSIRTSIYTDRNGKQHDKIEIWVSSMEMLTSKAQSQANAAAARPATPAAPQPSAQAPQQPAQSPASQQAFTPTPEAPFAPASPSDDQCPF